MKILFVLEHFYPYVGGAEELFLKLTISLAQKGYEVTIICTRHNTSIPRYEEYKGVKIHRVNCYNRFLFTIFSLPVVLRKAREADIIHTTSYNSAIPSFIAGLIRRKKVLITFHEVWGKLWMKLPFTPKWQLAAYYLFEQFILKLPFYKYIAVSKSTQIALQQHGIPAHRIEHIYNGVDYDVLGAYQHDSPSDFTFCYYGRLGISKGIDLLIEASGTFIRRHPEAKLKLIIPTYPEKLFSKVMQMVRGSGIADNIILLHDLAWSDLLREVSTSSCVVIPSHSEGFCFVAAESTAMGVPVISSGKGALSEVVGGKHILMEYLTSEDIDTALEKAITGNWDHSASTEFSLEKSVKGYMDMYQEME